MVKIPCFRALLALWATLAVYSSCGIAAPLTLADGGQSSFRIVTAQDAPSSVRAAAQELQKDIELASGAKLPIVRDDAAVSTPFISLGATQQAKAAGVLRRAIAAEGFALLARDGNFYIWGPDTADGEFTENGGTSNGTANGVYTFLEDYVGVRWLLPGDLGRDVPRQSTLRVPEMDRTEAPFFINRREPYIQNTLPAVSQWEAQQKLGYSFRINHGHNWTKTITPDLYEKHPDWFPMIGGKRPVPTGQYKLETTNPEVVKFFAARAIKKLKENPQANTSSLSPSDGRGYSQSPESKALYDPVPLGGHFPGTASTHPSVTPLILKFYREVSEIVAKEYPQGKLAGYLYNEYLFPPTKGGMTLPDNFYPVIASSLTYGYTLYRDDVRRYYRDLLEKWSEVTPHLFYYDLPTTISPDSGVVTPAAPEILNIIFPALVKNNVKGVYVYGNTSWTNGALGNYLLAKMIWNPHLDARALQREWLQRAYGEAAGAEMGKFYAKLDGYFSEYYRTHENARYKFTDEMLQTIYAPHYAELEKLFLQAKAQPMSEVQQQRLQMIEDNLIVLQWRLRNMQGGLPESFVSTLRRDDKAVNALLFRANADFELFPGLVDEGPRPPKVQVQAGAALPGKAAPSTLALRGQNQALLYAAQDGTVRVTPRPVKHAASAVNYVLKDGEGRTIAAGAVALGKTASFELKARTPYFLYVPRGIYNLRIEGAAVAYRTDLPGDGRFHLFSEPATFYHYVPAGARQWKLMLASAAPGETARVIVTAPDGKQAAVLETVTQPTQATTLPGQSGFWKIEVEEAASGLLDDVFLVFDKTLAQWVSADPQQPLIVSPAK